jgi:hypothetical protein
MVMRIAFALLLSCLALKQDTADEIQKVILQLSDESTEVRAKAEATLLSLGTKAIPALRDACTSVNSRTRENAQRLFARIDRVEFEKVYDTMNRQSVMALRSVDDFQKRYPFEVEGGRYKAAVYTDIGGLALSTSFSAFPTQFEFDIVAVTDGAGKPLVVERCGVCSPGWVHVMSSGPVRVKYSVTRQWFSDYELKFENPKNGDQKHVGDFTITIKWPELELTSKRPFVETDLKSYALHYWFEHKDPDKTPHISGGGGRYGGRFAGKPAHTTWCMCEGGPKPGEKRIVEALTSRRIKYALDGVEGIVMPDKIDDVAEIRLSFSKPIKETFELESPEIKPSKVLGER